MQRFAKCISILQKQFIIHLFTYSTTTMTKFSSILISQILLTTWRNYSVISHTTEQNSHSKHKWFNWNYQDITYKINLPKYFPFTHNCLQILCRSGDTESLWRRRYIVMYVAQKTKQSFFLQRTVCFGTALAKFGFVMYLNQPIHVIIGPKRDVPWIVRSEALTERLPLEHNIHILSGEYKPLRGEIETIIL